MEAGESPAADARADQPLAILGSPAASTVVTRHVPWIARRAVRRAADQRLRLRRQQRPPDRRAPGVGDTPPASSRRPARPGLPRRTSRWPSWGSRSSRGRTRPRPSSFVARWAEAPPGPRSRVRTIDFDAAALGIPPADLRARVAPALAFHEGRAGAGRGDARRDCRATERRSSWACSAMPRRLASRCDGGARRHPRVPGARAAHRSRRRGLHAQHHRQPIGPALGPPWPERRSLRGRTLRPRAACRWRRALSRPARSTPRSWAR